MKLIDYLIPLFAYLKAFDASTTRTPEALSAEIDTLVNQARTHALKDGYALDRFREGLFAASAWGDEQIARARAWGNEHAWQPFLLQRRYFRTSLAGREFFERLEKIDPADNELREVYLLCLCLHFQGRYSLASSSADLASLQIEQYRLLQQNDTALGHVSTELFPEAYQAASLARGRNPQRLRRLPWRRILFFVLPPLILVIVALMMHENLTTEVQLFRESINL